MTQFRLALFDLVWKMLNSHPLNMYGTFCSATSHRLIIFEVALFSSRKEKDSLYPTSFPAPPITSLSFFRFTFFFFLHFTKNIHATFTHSSYTKLHREHGVQFLEIECKMSVTFGEHISAF